MPTSGLIITADDYGLNQYVNEGTREAVASGIVTSVHVMPNLVNQNDINLLIDAIHQGGNKCGIGLHINTTWWRAIIQEEAGFKHNYRAGEWRYHDLNTYNHKHVSKSASDLAKMKREMWAQFDYLSTLIGGKDKIDAISSHYNFHLWDKTYLGYVKEIAKTASIPVRSPMRWVTKRQKPKTKKYPLGTDPLTKAAFDRIKKMISNRSTLKLMKTSLDWRTLTKHYDDLISSQISVARNSSGHWFGQPSLDAAKWFIEELALINEADNNSGYASEIFMHISNNMMGGDSRYGYTQAQRRTEYNIIRKQSFINAFNEWIANHETRHGSYRKVLQGKDVSYSKTEILV